MSTQQQLGLYDAVAVKPSALRFVKNDVCANRHGGNQLKRQGQERAAEKHAIELMEAKLLAYRLGTTKAEVTIEDVRIFYEKLNGNWDLGNAAGSVFKGSEWECVGYREATRPEAHARILRVWRLKK